MNHRTGPVVLRLNPTGIRINIPDTSQHHMETNLLIYQSIAAHHLKISLNGFYPLLKR
jgi:hypothetical protein